MGVPNARIAAKMALAAGVHYSGLCGLLAWPARHSVILGYHRVLPAGHETVAHIEPGMYVSTATFEAHLSYLSRTYEVVPLERIAAAGCLRTVENACVITFDDGYHDNYEYAFPILRKFGVPATIFLATAFVGSQEWRWTDRVSWIMRSRTPDEVAGFIARLATNGLDLHDELADLEQGRAAGPATVQRVITRLKQYDNTTVTGLVASAARNACAFSDDIPSPHTWLTWEEVAEMHANGISFGGHTHNHVILTRTPAGVAADEVRACRRELENHLGARVDLFSYPNGSVDEAVIGMVAREGFRCACTTQRGFLETSRGPMQLHRFLVHDDAARTIPMLACKLATRVPFF